MGGVTAYQPRLPGRRLRQQVAADVTRRQPQGAAAGHHDVRKILANTFALLQGFERWRVDLGAVAFISHGAVYALHQIMRGFRQEAARREAGQRKPGKGVVAGHIRRGKTEFPCAVVSRAGTVAKLFAHLLPRQLRPGDEVIRIQAMAGCRG
ncbi:hypothetical protein D9M73_90560 [compost metagenome]